MTTLVLYINNVQHDILVFVCSQAKKQTFHNKSTQTKFCSLEETLDKLDCNNGY